MTTLTPPCVCPDEEKAERLRAEREAQLIINNMPEGVDMLTYVLQLLDEGRSAVGEIIYGLKPEPSK